MSRSQEEFRLTCVVADWLRANWPADLRWSHFPAGENRSAATGARLQRMGTAKGWPDFILNLPGGRVGYIELKSPTGRLQPEQRSFRDDVTANGAKWALCRSRDEVAAVCALWLPNTRIAA